LTFSRKGPLEICSCPRNIRVRVRVRVRVKIKVRVRFNVRVRVRPRFKIRARVRFNVRVSVNLPLELGPCYWQLIRQIRPEPLT